MNRWERGQEGWRDGVSVFDLKKKRKKKKKRGGGGEGKLLYVCMCWLDGLKKWVEGRLLRLYHIISLP